MSPAAIAMFVLYGLLALVTHLSAPIGAVWKAQPGIDGTNLLGMAGNMMTIAAYLFMGIPAGRLLSTIGYRKTALSALVVGVIGTVVQIGSSRLGWRKCNTVPEAPSPRGVATHRSCCRATRRGRLGYGVRPIFIPNFVTLATVCALSCSAVAEIVPTAPDGYRRPSEWQPNRYPKGLQQIADESSAEQAARAKCEMARVDGVNGCGRWKADLSSLGKHACPAWFEDAKLGVFIDWNLYSVASYAREKPDAAFYPDWYCDFMHYNPEDSKDAHLAANGIRSYHEATWGKDFKRDDFIPLFTGRAFDANKLCGFLKDCGARYFVPFLKHHDGFCLWDSTWTYRTSVRRGPKRDFAAEMVAACKAQGLKFGFYFSTGEWEYPFLKDDGRIEVRPGGLGCGAPWPQDRSEFETRISGKVAVRDYKREYVIPQAVEFIDRYDPDLVWFDGEWDSPWTAMGAGEITAYFYNRAEGRKEVAVNDRFGLRRALPPGHTRKEMFENLLRCHSGDFYTDESGDVADQLDPMRHHAWEECTGISKCYGNHWNESEANVMSERAFLEKFTGIVARGGNLLLLVNLDAEGRIPKTEELRLRQIGAWLKKNGEAIYGTRICAPYSTKAVDYTQSKDGRTSYAIVKESTASVNLECAVPRGAHVTLLETGKELALQVKEDGVRVVVPAECVKAKLPYVLRIDRKT